MRLVAYQQSEAESKILGKFTDKLCELTVVTEDELQPQVPDAIVPMVKRQMVAYNMLVQACMLFAQVRYEAGGPEEMGDPEAYAEILYGAMDCALAQVRKAVAS